LEDDMIVLMLGSGDREKPRNYDNPVDNYFFVLKDRPTDPTWLTTEVANCGVAALCLNSLTPILTAANPTQEALAAKKGWYLGLRDTEQVVTSAITIYGTITFSTHQPRQPQGNVCSSDLGSARVYNVSYVDASSRNGTPDRSEEQPATIGLSPNPVGGVVTLDDDTQTNFIIGAEPCGPLCPTVPAPPTNSVPTPPKSRVYWYIER
jgi:type IV pilus assembly protein PilY1